jgi:hypothetical protein
MADDSKSLNIDVKGYGVVQVPAGLDEAGMRQYINQKIKSGGGRGGSSNIGQTRGGSGGGAAGSDAPPDPNDFTHQSAGFVRSAIDAANPLPALRLAGEGFEAGVSGDSAKTVKFGSDVWKDVLAPMYAQTGKGWESFKEGRPIEGAAYYGASVLPGVGPAIMHGYEQMESGDTAGAAGTWAGTFSGLAAGEGFSRIAGKLREVAPSVYGKGLEIKVGKGGLGREELQQVRERGLGRQTAGAAPPGAPVVASDTGIDDLDTRISDTKSTQMGEIANAQASGVKIPTGSVTKPLEDMIKRWKKSAMADAAKPLEEVLNTFNKNHPMSLIEPKDVQELKENTDEVLKSNVWGKDMEPGARDAAGKELRTAMRQALEGIANVKELNQAMHLDLALRKGIEQALEKRSFKEEISKIGPIGGFTLYELGKGNVKVATAVAAAKIAQAALKSPQSMTRLGIALDRAGVSLPPVLKTLGRTSPFALGMGKNEAPPGAGDSITVHSADDIIKQWQSEAAGGRQ